MFETYFFAKSLKKFVSLVVTSKKDFLKLLLMT
jgi:hypothetical protein